MKRIFIFLFVIALLLSACSAIGGTDTSEQLVSMQATIDALTIEQSLQATQTAAAAMAIVPPQSGDASGNEDHSDDVNQPAVTNPPQNTAPTDPPPPTATPAASAAQRSSDLNNITIMEFDNVGMAWQTGCTYVRQEMGGFGTGWNENDHWFGSQEKCEMAFDLPITVSGTYEFFLAATYAPDFGNLGLQAYSGNQTINFANISLYEPNVKPTGELPIGKGTFTAGETAQFVIYINGKVPASTDYKFGLDYLKLVLIEAN